jgi:protein SCO1/2
MKTFLTLALATLLPAAALATDADAHACCAHPVAEAQASFTANSLYQLDQSWTDDAGQTRTLADFRGQPLIVAMVFTHCDYACPAIVNDLRRVQAQLAPAVRARARLVLISFDTVRDTPAALAAYRQHQQLDASWTLLHGSPDAVREIAMLLGVKYQQDTRGGFSHSNVFTVLNAEGEIVHQHVGLFNDVAPAVAAATAAVK